MKDGMNNLLRERFHGHESPVDPSVWTGIQQQMSVPASGGQGVEGLFQKRFQGHEAPVDASVWQGISAQLGHGAAVGTAAGTLSWAVAGVAVIALGVLGYFLLKEPSTEVTKQPVVELIAPNPTTTNTEPPLEQIPENSVTNGTAVGEATVDKVVRSIPVEQKVAPRVDRTPTQPSNPANASSVTNKGDKQPADPRSLPPEMATSTTIAHTPVAGRVDAPEKVESIIRKLTDEVQMEVLSKPAVAEEVTKPIEDRSSDPVAADRYPAPLPKLFMPNTFTPNGDGVNDTYTLEREGYRSMMIRVYSMKNDQLVFSTNSGEAWTGDKCEDGMYMVAVEAITDDGRTMSEGKVVWLTRVRLN